MYTAGAENKQCFCVGHLCSSNPVWKSPANLGNMVASSSASPKAISNKEQLETTPRSTNKHHGTDKYHEETSVGDSRRPEDNSLTFP
jgi:hypothetical protein